MGHTGSGGVCGDGFSVLFELQDICCGGGQDEKGKFGGNYGVAEE